MCEQPEPVGPTIPKTKIFDGITILEEGHINEEQPFFDVYYSDNEQQAYPTFDHYKYTEEPVSQQNHPMVPIYDEYESDLGETESEEQNISCPELVSEQRAYVSCTPTCDYQRYSTTCEQLCSRGGCLSPIFWNLPLIL